MARRERSVVRARDDIVREPEARLHLDHFAGRRSERVVNDEGNSQDISVTTEATRAEVPEPGSPFVYALHIDTVEMMHHVLFMILLLNGMHVVV